MVTLPTRTTLLTLAASLGLAASATAVEVPVPLNYNFNGMVHSGEVGQTDSLTGFRSIADRGLLIDGLANSFGTGGVTSITSGLHYTIVSAANVVDIVHLGNRLVYRPYDLTVDGDNIGVQPTWDVSPNHLVPQVSDVSAANIQLFANSRIGVLHQISDLGTAFGNFQMVVTFTDTSSVTLTVAGPDWFGVRAMPAAGPGITSVVRLNSALFNGTTGNDSGVLAPVTERLNVSETVISVQEMINDGLGDHSGKTIQSITFQNPLMPVGNSNRGYAIFAMTVDGSAVFGPSGVASTVPAAPIFNQAATLNLTITPGQPAPNAIVSATVNGSSINLPNPIDLVDQGGGLWSANVVIPADAPAGIATLPYDAVDAQGRHATGNFVFNIVAPPAAIDLGHLPSSGIVTANFEMSVATVQWYKFTLDTAIDAAQLKFLDIDTEGTAITGGATANDTEIGIFSADGTFIATDDDGGTGFLSAMSFGVASPARPAPGDGLAYNGRSGAVLAAGDYYIAVSGYNVTFANNWSVPNGTPAPLYAGPAVLRLAVGTIPAGGLPAVFTDLGTLGASPVSSTQNIAAAGGVVWFKFVLDTAVVADLRQFIDLDTEGSALANTSMALFRDNGSGTLVTADDNDGSGSLSQLTYGRGTRTAVGDGLAYNGRDGATGLIAGTYYVAVTESPVVFGNNFVVFAAGGTNTGDVTLNISKGTMPPPLATILAGPIHNPLNGHDYYLFNTGLNFLDAEAAAVAQLNGHLASIGDADENEFVRAQVLAFDGLTTRRAWIGFTDRDSEGFFVWTDGDSNGFTNWNGGEPNNAGGLEHYTEMLGNGGWNDLPLAGAATGDFAVVEVPGGGNGGCQPADIADDTGAPLPSAGSNTGVNEGDYNAFFAGFFDALSYCDQWDDAGVALTSTDPLPGINNGVNEGDYNGFFATFFNGCP